MRLGVARLDLFEGRLPGGEPLAARGEARLLQARPHRLDAPPVLGVRLVGAAHALVHLHEAVVGEPGGPGPGPGGGALQNRSLSAGPVQPRLESAAGLAGPYLLLVRPGAGEGDEGGAEGPREGPRDVGARPGPKRHCKRGTGVRSGLPGGLAARAGGGLTHGIDGRGLELLVVPGVMEEGEAVRVVGHGGPKPLRQVYHLKRRKRSRSSSTSISQLRKAIRRLYAEEGVVSRSLTRRYNATDKPTTQLPRPQFGLVAFYAMHLRVAHTQLFVKKDFST